MLKLRYILLVSLVLVFAAGLAYAGCGKKHGDMQGEMSKPCCAKAEQKPCCDKQAGEACAKRADCPKPCCAKMEKQAAAEQAPAARSDVLYACDCGAGCDCNTLSKTPGQCACGKDLRWHHIVKVEGDEALLCTCGEGCQCALSQDDPNKCACGNPVKRVSLKDSGLFFCNCGGACTCNTVSDKPGECGCGMQLKES